MTTTDVALINEADLAELAALAGADPDADRGPRVPVLKVNMDDQDEAGNELPRGHLFVTEQGEAVYAKTVTIRPLTQHYQYADFDGDEKKLRSKTVLNSTFRQEFIDTAGTIRCGRPGGKEWKAMDEEDKKRFKDISCTRQLGVLVSYTGKTKDGKEVAVENVPALVKLKGSNFMGFDDEFVKNLPKGRKLWDFQTEVSLERQKNGSVVYFVWHYKTDFDAPLPLDQVTLDTIREFAGMVESENQQVRKAHDAAIRKRTGDADLYDNLGGGENLDDDFIDA